jgi:hypothetical protein
MEFAYSAALILSVFCLPTAVLAQDTRSVARSHAFDIGAVRLPYQRRTRLKCKLYWVQWRQRRNDPFGPGE